jgi:hypothetical protein
VNHFVRDEDPVDGDGGGEAGGTATDDQHVSGHVA